MSDQENIVVEAWDEVECCKGVPPWAVLACIHELRCQFVEVEEYAFVRVKHGRTELWVDESSIYPDIRNWTFGCRATMPTAGDLRADSIRLLGLLFRAREGYQGPTGRVIRSGLVSESDFQQIVSAGDRVREENLRLAKEGATAIVAVAGELRLDPRPSGRHPAEWWACCPGVNHHLHIHADTELFYCGYCRRGGGESELRQFVEERRQKALK